MLYNRKSLAAFVHAQKVGHVHNFAEDQREFHHPLLKVHVCGPLSISPSIVLDESHTNKLLSLEMLTQQLKFQHHYNQT